MCAVLAGSPKLAKAACRRQPLLFDADCADIVEAENREREALRLCRACPELEACREWVESLPPSQRPHGVVAGKVIRKARQDISGSYPQSIFTTHNRQENIMTIPTLDAARTAANAELGRAIIDYLGVIEPAIDEIDTLCSMPIRLVHNDAMGFGLEVGPYDLDGSDIERLRAAINAYDQAVGA